MAYYVQYIINYYYYINIAVSFYFTTPITTHYQHNCHHNHRVKTMKPVHMRISLSIGQLAGFLYTCQ
jgi:hypothetical protein